MLTHVIPEELVRREASPSPTFLPGPWSEAPNAPPGSPGCARPMSLLVHQNPKVTLFAGMYVSPASGKPDTSIKLLLNPTYFTIVPLSPHLFHRSPYLFHTKTYDAHP